MIDVDADWHALDNGLVLNQEGHYPYHVGTCDLARVNLSPRQDVQANDEVEWFPHSSQEDFTAFSDTWTGSLPDQTPEDAIASFEADFPTSTLLPGRHIPQAYFSALDRAAYEPRLAPCAPSDQPPLCRRKWKRVDNTTTPVTYRHEGQEEPICQGDNIEAFGDHLTNLRRPCNDRKPSLQKTARGRRGIEKEQC